MELIIIVLSGIGGAWLMTLFLSVINRFISHGVRVPLILGQVFHHYFSGSSFYHLRHKNTYGHVIHNLVSVFFAFCYLWLWRNGIGGPSAPDILLFGFVNGLVGVAGWFVFLRATYEPQQVKEKVFFPVILIAHLVFALGVTAIYFALWPVVEASL